MSTEGGAVKGCHHEKKLELGVGEKGSQRRNPKGAGVIW